MSLRCCCYPGGSVAKRFTAVTNALVVVLAVIAGWSLWAVRDTGAPVPQPAAEEIEKLNVPPPAPIAVLSQPMPDTACRNVGRVAGRTVGTAHGTRTAVPAWFEPRSEFAGVSRMPLNGLPGYCRRALTLRLSGLAPLRGESSKQPYCLRIDKHALLRGELSDPAWRSCSSPGCQRFRVDERRSRDAFGAGALLQPSAATQRAYRDP